MPDSSRECDLIMERLDEISERLSKLETDREVDARLRQWIGSAVLAFLGFLGTAFVWFTGGGEAWLRDHLKG